MKKRSVLRGKGTSDMCKRKREESQKTVHSEFDIFSGVNSDVVI